MKMLVAGVQRMAGVSKKSGNQFDMYRLLCLVPLEIVNSASLQINGSGFKVSEVPVDPAAFSKFMALPAAQFPMELDIDVEPRPHRGGFESVVVGFKTVPLKAAA